LRRYLIGDSGHQVAVGVDDSNPAPCGDVLHRHRLKERGLSRTGLAEDVYVAATIRETDSETRELCARRGLSQPGDVVSCRHTGPSYRSRASRTGTASSRRIARFTEITSEHTGTLEYLIGLG